ncbi:hypothetical protein AB3S75_037022 [Citrus x aurantiifolia]
MESKFGRIDGRTAPSWPSPSPSSQSSSYSSDDQARRGGNYSMDADLLKNPRLLYTLQREIENEIIRHEVIAAEIERRRLPEEEARRELMIEREMAMHRAREMGLSIDDMLLMQLHTRYPWFPFSRNLGLGFGHDVLPSTPPYFSHGLWSGLDVNKKDELTMLGKPDSNFCGSKPKAATPPSGSGGHPSTSSNKPKEWSCALCRFSAITERGLDVHLQGTKHKAKAAALLRNKKMFCKRGLDECLRESRGCAGQKMKTKVQEESVNANKTVGGLNQKVKGALDEHPQGKKHKGKVVRLLRDKKMCSNSPSSTSKKSIESRGGAGQKMKTKVQKESVKANKTVGGLNQKVKVGLHEHPQGKKHKAKVARLLRDKKMCSNSTSSTSKKSTESRGGAGQKMKIKMQEESVKANKTVVGLDQKVNGGLDQRPQVKKHKDKEGLPGAQKWGKKYTESRESAGQEMKAKAEKGSVKANKTVVGLDQKGKGGQALQVKPYPNLCGSKQEAAILPADSGKLRLMGLKKPMHWSCALCQVSATSKGELVKHLQGKKHKAKEEELLGAQKWTKKSTESRDIAGQEMKTKVEEKSVKANKTVVGSDQKGKGGQALQVKPYPNFCGSKQEAGALPADSGKRRLTTLKKPMHWSCALCQVSATSKRGLDEHLKGKKHKAKEEGLNRGKKHMAQSNESEKNDEVVPLTTSTTIVTPLEPTEKVEDEDVVAKESNEETADSVIENAEDEEVVVYRGRQSGPGALDSLLC